VESVLEDIETVLGMLWKLFQLFHRMLKLLCSTS